LFSRYSCLDICIFTSFRIKLRTASVGMWDKIDEFVDRPFQKHSRDLSEWTHTIVCEMSAFDTASFSNTGFGVWIMIKSSDTNFMPEYLLQNTKVNGLHALQTLKETDPLDCWYIDCPTTIISVVKTKSSQRCGASLFNLTLYSWLYLHNLAESAAVVHWISACSFYFTAYSLSGWVFFYELLFSWKLAQVLDNFQHSKTTKKETLKDERTTTE